jgi:aminopeptidase
VDARSDRLAELAVSGANVQPGQILVVNAEHGQAELARAVAAAGYRHGARFVEVIYFDPHVKRARIELAVADTLDFVPEWLGDALVAHAEGRGARIVLAGVTEPHVFDGLDPERAGKDHLPRLKENSRIVGERMVNWCVIAAPHPSWATLVYPQLGRIEAYERLWLAIEHLLRLDEADPVGAWEERMAVLRERARELSDRGFDAMHLAGPGTDLSVGLFRSAGWLGGGMETASGLRHFPNLPTEEIFTTPDPARTEGYVTATKPLVLNGGPIIRGLRVRFERGRAVEIEADENGAALRHTLEVDEAASRLGELALIDGSGRVGRLDTVFYHTLLDENAASHIALGSGFPFLVDDEAERSRTNLSSLHIDFMIGSAELEVTGISASGERTPVLRDGDWQL